MVECGGQGALLEVAADDRHRVDRRSGRYAKRAQRSDQAAAGGVPERQVVDRGGEDIRDLLRDQLLRRGHADVDRVREAADRSARLLAERRVRLVGDHQVVRLRLEVAPVAREPGVGLNRQRVGLGRPLAAFDGVDDPVAVPLCRQIAVELGDEQPAVGEDQDAERACGFDESGRGDRLAGRRRMAEPEAADSAWVFLRGERQLVGVAVGGGRFQLLFLVLLGLDVRGVPVPIRGLGSFLRGCDQLREHSGERVDLVASQLRAGGEPGRAVSEHALETEHQRVTALPLVRGRVQADVHLRDSVIQRESACRAGRQHDGRVFVSPEKWLSGPILGAGGGLAETVCRLRR